MYELFNGLLNNARAKHLPNKRVKYKKKVAQKIKIDNKWNIELN